MNSDLLNKQARRAEPFLWNANVEEATGRAFNWQCPFCASSLQGEKYHKAHVWPVGYGVGIVPGNVVLTCPDCNMAMHNQPMWQWCAAHGISFGHIQFTLEVIARIFSDDSALEITVPDEPYVQQATRHSFGQTKVIEHLMEFPEHAALPSRELAKIIGVGHDTANKGRNAWRDQQARE